jgi:hypothetical protein
METLFFHGKTTDGRRFTIAGKFTQKGKILKKNVLLLGASLCSRNDCFIKKVGRYKAEGRLMSVHNKGKVMYPVLVIDNQIQVFIQTAMNFTSVDSISFQRQFNLYHS